MRSLVLLYRWLGPTTEGDEIGIARVGRGLVVGIPQWEISKNCRAPAYGRPLALRRVDAQVNPPPSPFVGHRLNEIYIRLHVSGPILSTLNIELYD